LQRVDFSVISHNVMSQCAVAVYCLWSCLKTNVKD